MKKVETKKYLCFYIGSLHKGGAERVFVNLAEYFRQEGYRVTMVTQYRKEDEYLLPEGIARVISEIDKKKITGSRVINFCRRVRKLHPGAYRPRTGTASPRQPRHACHVPVLKHVFGASSGKTPKDAHTHDKAEARA